MVIFPCLQVVRELWTPSGLFPLWQRNVRHKRRINELSQFWTKILNTKTAQCRAIYLYIGRRSSQKQLFLFSQSANILCQILISITLWNAKTLQWSCSRFECRIKPKDVGPDQRYLDSQLPLKSIVIKGPNTFEDLGLCPWNNMFNSSLFFLSVSRMLLVKLCAELYLMQSPKITCMSKITSMECIQY